MRQKTKEDISQEMSMRTIKLKEGSSFKNCPCLAVGTITLPSMLSLMTPNYKGFILIKPEVSRVKLFKNRKKTKISYCPAKSYK